jgi:hypothetical protein
MSIKKIWGSRVKTDAATYIADDGLIFYDEVDGELRLGDGVTPGGVAISVRADLIVAQRLTPGEDNDDAYGLGDETHRWWDLHIGDGGIHYNGFSGRPQIVPYIPGAQLEDIIPGADNGIDLGAPDKRFANIYLGYDGLFLADQTTDANINITVNAGTLYIDGAENLRLGNLAIRDTTLTSANNTLDISIGDAGDTGFFYVKRKAQIDNTTFSSTQAMLGINASGGAEPATIFPDTLVQTVGRPNKNSRVVQRAYGSTGTVGGDNSYAVWASYAARGSVASPAALKEDDILARLSANGFGTTTWGAGGARVEFVALENFTDSAKGTKINFWTTPAGQVTPQNVASINSTGVVTQGIKFSGDETLQTTAGIPLTAKGNPAATQVATLGIDGKLDAGQIPASLTGAIIFKGTWNAFTNTPTLGDGLPSGVQAGWQYVVDVGGTRDIGDGSKTFVAGDFVIYDGTDWKQVPSGNLFTSLTGGGGITVSQSTGAITLGSTATPLSNVSTIVSRDSSGNFAANVITANLTGVVTGSVSGNAGTVTNGVYTTDTSTVTNTMLAGSIANNKLANSTISGIALGSNLAALTISTYLTGTSYNGSIAATIAVDATTAATANKVVARDASGDIFARIVSDSLGNIRSIPINNKVAGYILASTDNGQMISITTGGVTINTGVFASPYGQSISIYNNSASSQTITQGAGVTLRLAGTAATGNRTLARYGVATIVCVASETFVISGAGLV